jgi:hypothetical protein
MLPFFAMPAQARLVEVFKYQDYFDKADFIVIARPISRTADVNQKSILDEIQGTHISADPLGVETKFEVTKVIKGDAKVTHFVLHHYRESAKPDSHLIQMDGPDVISFYPDRYGDCLMFLAKEKSGRFVPFSGQMDARRSIICSMA